jgi:hypothetical protein
LVRQHPNVPQYVADLGSVLNAIVEVRLLAGDELGEPQAESLDELQDKAQQRFEWVREQDKPSGQYSTGFVTSILLKARLLVLAKAADKAKGMAAWAGKELENRTSAEEQYQLAAALALRAEIEGAKPHDARNKAAVTCLKKAFEAGFRRLHPKDVAKDRAFRSLADNEDFEKLIQAQTEEWAKAAK